MRRKSVGMQALRLWLLLAIAVMNTLCDDDDRALDPPKSFSDGGGQAPIHRPGLTWGLRERGQVVQTPDVAGLVAPRERAAGQDSSQEHNSQQEPLGATAEAQACTSDSAGSAPAAVDCRQGNAAAARQSAEPETKTAEEAAAASEQRSLFAKIVDLVAPPSLPAQVLSPSTPDDEQGVAAADLLAKAGTNASVHGANVTGAGHVPPTEPDEAHSRGDVNDSGSGAASGSAGSGGTPIELSVADDAPSFLTDEQIAPVDIGPEIFEVLIPSIQLADDACAGKCTINTCSGHGVCSGHLCQCNCSATFTGRYCHEQVAPIKQFQLTPPVRPCPDNCSNQGDCRHGTCSCHKGWAGYNCSIECMGGVTNPCSGHGVCLQTSGKCLCSEGYAGKNCTRRSVPQDFDNYRKMVLLSESKEKEAKEKEAKEKEAKEKAAAAGAMEEGGSLGASGTRVGSEGLKRGESQDASVNESSPVEVTSGGNGGAGNTSYNATASGHDVGNLTSKNVSAAAAAAAAAEKLSGAKKKKEGSKWVKGVEVSSEHVRRLGVDHAAYDMGAKALATNKEASAESALLKSDKDKYWISPCKVDKGVMWVVIELNEIIHVRTIVIGSFEYYSSTPHRFQVLGQLAYPTDHWNVMGYFEASASRTRQEFTIKTPMMAKVIKIRVLTHHGNEFYCTMSSVQVYGTTQWEEMGRALEENEQQVKIVKRALDGGSDDEEEVDSLAQQDEAALAGGDTATNATALANSTDFSSLLPEGTQKTVTNASKESGNVSTAQAYASSGNKILNDGISGVDVSMAQGPKNVSENDAVVGERLESEDMNLSSEVGGVASNDLPLLDNPAFLAAGPGGSVENSGHAPAASLKDRPSVPRDAEISNTVDDSMQTGRVQGYASQMAQSLSSEPGHDSQLVNLVGEAASFNHDSPALSVMPAVRSDGVRQGQGRRGDEYGMPDAESSDEEAMDGDNWGRPRESEVDRRGRSEPVNPEVTNLMAKRNASRPALGEDPMFVALPRLLVPPISGEWEGGDVPLAPNGAGSEASSIVQTLNLRSESVVHMIGEKEDLVSIAQNHDTMSERNGSAGVDGEPVLAAEAAEIAREWRKVTETIDWGDFYCLPEDKTGEGEFGLQLSGGHEEDGVCLALEIERDSNGALILPSALAGRADGEKTVDLKSDVTVSDDVGVVVLGGGQRDVEVFEGGLTGAYLSGGEAVAGGDRAHGDGAAGDRGEGMDKEEENEVKRLQVLEEEELKVKAEEDAAKAEDVRKKEERRKMLDEQKRAVMAGMVSGPTSKGELSFFKKVPEKIKMLEINLSFLQSYMEETKKGHDESFEDISSEVEHLKAALAALKAEVQAGTADMASRFKTLEDKWSVMEAEHKVTAEKMEEQQGLLDQLKVSGTWGAAGVGAVGRGWGGWLAVFMAVVGVFVAVWWLFGSASTNGKGLEGLRGKAWSALYALAGHLRLVKQLEAVLSLLGYRHILRAHKSAEHREHARKPSLSHFHAQTRAASGMGTSVPHPWKSHLARAHSDAGYTNTRREGGVLLPGDGGAGEWSGVPASGDGDFEHSGLSVHSDTSSGVDLGGVLDGRQTSGSSHDKTPKSSREGPNGQANSHNRRSQRPDTKAPQRTKTAEGFREKQKGESNQHKMFGGQKEMEDGGAEEEAGVFTASMEDSVQVAREDMVASGKGSLVYELLRGLAMHGLPSTNSSDSPKRLGGKEALKKKEKKHSNPTPAPPSTPDVRNKSRFDELEMGGQAENTEAGTFATLPNLNLPLPAYFDGARHSGGGRGSTKQANLPLKAVNTNGKNPESHKDGNRGGDQGKSMHTKWSQRSVSLDDVRRILLAHQEHADSCERPAEGEGEGEGERDCEREIGDGYLGLRVTAVDRVDEEEQTDHLSTTDTSVGTDPVSPASPSRLAATGRSQSLQLPTSAREDGENGGGGERGDGQEGRGGA